MRIDIMTLFPETLGDVLSESILGRAQERGYIHIDTHQIRDYTANKQNQVDDYPYGGGRGAIMNADPLYRCWEAVCDEAGGPVHTIYLSPCGHTFRQADAIRLSKLDNLILVCGHYEGIDQRFIDECVDEEISLGDFVLTGGEIAAMAVTDAVCRMVPGVLADPECFEDESHFNGLLEYPQYTRPAVWHGRAIPEILTSGNHEKVRQWRRKQSLRRTRERRPDLYEKYDRLQQCVQILMKQKLLHMDMIELIRRGRARLVYQQEGEILLKDMVTGIYFHTRMMPLADHKDWKLPEYLKEHGESISCMVTHQENMVDVIQTKLGLSVSEECWQVVYTKREKMPVRGLYGPNGIRKEDGLCIRLLDETSQEFVVEHYETGDSGAYVRSRIHNKAVYGAFYGEKIVGFAGQHEEGSLGMLFVLPQYRSRHVAAALETYMVNLSVERGEVPYGHVITGNTACEKMQESLGLCKAKGKVYWMSKKS